MKIVMNPRVLYFCILFVIGLFVESNINGRTNLNKTELPFVVVICSMNNSPWVEKNLDSVFMQEYSNYRVIYVDDASVDGTGDAVQQYMDLHAVHGRMMLIRNQVRCRKLKNEYKVFHMCADNEIIVQLDGDDWFAHSKVLSNLNDAYASGDVWLTYGSHENYPPSNIGSKSAPVQEAILKDRLFRKQSFIYMPTRSFYAWLVKQIKLEDLINDDVPGFEGKFYPTCDDVLLMWAMLEMAHYRFAYLKDVSYIANRDNPIISLNVDNSLLKDCAKSLRKTIPLYAALESPIIERLQQFDTAVADIVIISEDSERVSEVYATLQNYVSHKGALWVFYDTLDKKKIEAYAELATIYTDIKFVNIACNKKGMSHYICSSHVLVIKDSTSIASSIDCRSCIQQLERTAAYAAYFSLKIGDFETFNIPFQHIDNDLYAWKFSCDNNNQLNIQPFDGVLYRTGDVLEELTWASLCRNPSRQCFSAKDFTKKVGLFFVENKIESNF